jgi:hypothetical protein
LTNELRYKSQIRKLGIYYPLHYILSEDGKNFVLEVGHGFNMGVFVKGGVGKKLKAFYTDEAGESEIPIK